MTFLIRKTTAIGTIASALLLALPAIAGEHAAINQAGAVKSPADKAKTTSFDILAAHVHRMGRNITFHMTTNGKAGKNTPKPVGQLGGSPVFGYVWPTSLDPSTVGFEGKTGILALAVTSHPDSRRSMTRTMMATSPMMASCGTATGWFSPRPRLVVKAHWRFAISLREKHQTCPPPGPACQS